MISDTREKGDDSNDEIEENIVWASMHAMGVLNLHFEPDASSATIAFAKPSLSGKTKSGSTIADTLKSTKRKRDAAAKKGKASSKPNKITSVDKATKASDMTIAHQTIYSRFTNGNMRVSILTESFELSSFSFSSVFHTSMDSCMVTKQIFWSLFVQATNIKLLCFN